MNGDTSEALGFLGGSFDPPHLGHLIIARDALEQLGLKKVYLIPALQSPLRQGSHLSEFSERLELCRALTQGHQDWLGALDIEGTLPAPSYTVNTASALTRMFPGSKLTWIIGADQWEKLPYWKEYENLGSILEFAVAARPGHAIKELPPPAPRSHLIQARNIEISSTEVRKRLYSKLPIDHLCPKEIYDLIKAKGLYTHHK